MAYEANIKRNIEKGKKGEYFDSKDKENFDYVTRKKLNHFNESLLKGKFFNARNILSDIYWNISSTRKGIPSEIANSYSKKEKEKLIEGINKRIERGRTYLKKHPNDENFDENKKYMKKILEISDDIENTLSPKESLSGLEKSLKVLSIGFVLLGIFFLSPNLTGNVIGTMAMNSSNIFGLALFALGIVGIFFIFRK